MEILQYKKVTANEDQKIMDLDIPTRILYDQKKDDSIIMTDMEWSNFIEYTLGQNMTWEQANTWRANNTIIDTPVLVANNGDAYQLIPLKYN